MSRFVIVPNSLRDAINGAIDKALVDAPPDAAKDRESFYAALLAYFDEHGTIPSFTIVHTALVASLFEGMVMEEKK